MTMTGAGSVPDVTIATVSRVGLCVSCMCCGSVCPVGAITYEMVAGVRRPRVDQTLCTTCGRCHQVCPAVHLPGAADAEAPGLEWIEGTVLGAFVGHSIRDEVRANAVSGGLASTLLIGLLRSGAVDSVFGLAYAGRASEQPDLVELPDEPAVLAAAGSKYAPPSADAVCRALASDERPRIAVVATPCVLQAILGYMVMKRIPRDRLLAIGLVCDRTLSPRAVEHLEVMNRVDDEPLTRFHYRTKKVGGWPGGVRLEYASGRIVDLSNKARTVLKGHYQLRRCTVCADKMNREADIVLGDCYIKGRESALGSSTIIVRSEAGEKALELVSAELDLQTVGADSIFESQAVSAKLPELTAAVVCAGQLGLPVGRAVSPSVASSVSALTSRQWAKIERAESAGPRRVALAVRRDRATARVARFALRAEQALAFSRVWWRARGVRVADTDDRPVQSIVVLGAGFSNKGAQALLFAVTDALRARFPDARVLVASAVPLEGAGVRYNVEWLPWTLGAKLAVAGVPVSDAMIRRYAAGLDLDHLRHEISTAACVIDVSGYRLSSEFGFNESLDYCLNLMIARLLRVPAYVLPQSFGPFEYGRLRWSVVRAFMRAALAGVNGVYAREPEGAELVHKATGATPVLAADIVLAHRERMADRIYLPGHGPQSLALPARFACVVPSMQVARRSETSAESLYVRVVDAILAQGRDVVLLSHSADDARLSRLIHSAVSAPERVTVIGEGLDAIELEGVLGQAEYLFASRYHAIVHAYRKCVPAVILGWAEKYRVLASIAAQSHNVLPDAATLEEVLAAVDAMGRGYAADSSAIQRALEAGLFDAAAAVVDELDSPVLPVGATSSET